MTKKLHICFCCRNEISADAFRSLLACVVDGADYWKHRFGKESTVELKVVARMHVVDGRTRLVKEAVEDGADFVWWLDDDMVPPIDTLQKLMERLDEHPEYDYIGALCYKKTPPYGPCAFVDPPGPDQANWVARLPERIQEVTVTGFACVLGRGAAFKHVFEKTEGFPFAYTPTCGEDAYYWSMARNNGQRVAVDTSLVVGHVGTHVFDEKTFDAYCQGVPETLKRLAP